MRSSHLHEYYTAGCRRSLLHNCQIWLSPCHLSWQNVCLEQTGDQSNWEHGKGPEARFTKFFSSQNRKIMFIIFFIWMLPIRKKFCTFPDSSAVGKCANFYGNIINLVTVKVYFFNDFLFWESLFNRPLGPFQYPQHVLFLRRKEVFQLHDLMLRTFQYL